MVDVVFDSTSFKQKDVKVLSQSFCTCLSHVDSSNLDKPFFLKNLFEVAKLMRLETVEDVLLANDSPKENLLNDVHSVVHFVTWFGDNGDRFITMHLLWLKGLFKSNEVVIEYMRQAWLLGGQLPEDQKSDLAIKILKDVLL